MTREDGNTRVDDITREEEIENEIESQPGDP